MFFSLFFSTKSQDGVHFNKEGGLTFPKPKFVPEYSNTNRQVLDEEWKNIRIKLNMSYVTGELRDPNACYEEGQILKFYNKNITCEKDMILSNTNLTSFTITLNNFKNFEEKFLKVLPSPNKDYDLELIIKIIRYPYIESFLRVNPDTYNEYQRTTKATMNFNHLGLPSQPSMWETESEEYMGNIMREFNKILDAIHGRYHPKNSTKPYKDNETYCSLIKYGRQFNFLIEPYSHLFAQKHYGVDVFEGDNSTCPSGIEIEYDGTRGTYNNYIRGRLFYTDLSVQLYLRASGNYIERLTDATMAIIQDTENYLCNWSMAQPLVWGNPETQIGGKPIKDLALGPPQLVFPKQYFYYSDTTAITLDKDSPQYVGFDFKHGGYTISSNAPSSCTGYWEDYCKRILQPIKPFIYKLMVYL